MLEFFEEERGINQYTLEAAGVEIDDDVARFSYPNGLKYRRHDENGRRHFWYEPTGAELGLFILADENTTGSSCYIVEGETDALRLWQELGYETAVFGLPGVNTWKDEYASYFEGFDRVYVILDNDEDYKVAATVDAAYHTIRKSLKSKAKRIRLPKEAKDLCVFFDKYDVEALDLLIETDAPVWHYEALDLTKEVGDIDWFIDGLIAKGDLSLLIGEPGVGKSWVSMSLAVAVAEGWDSFLGKPLRNLGEAGSRVLYVDEENPEFLVLYRMRKLGLTDEGAKNIRFLHRQGIRLDRRPELLHDEALDWEPGLIVLDSLTRMHNGDENNAGEVARLFNDGINPLARETGATTLLLHHVTKTESPSSFARARGSGDISASIDTGIDLRSTDEHGGFDLLLYKSRWIEEGVRLNCRRRDIGETVTLEGETRKIFF